MWAAMLSAMAAVVKDGVDWGDRSPGRPRNFTVTANTTSCELEWRHASASDGGLSTHYVLKWMKKDGRDIEWYPNWVSVGKGGLSSILLTGLAPGREYAVRVASVNPQGRNWSLPVSFQTLAAVRCDETAHWRGLLEDADAAELCGPGSDLRYDDPDGRTCGVSSMEYVLAGTAAGVAMALVFTAMLLRRTCFRLLCSIDPVTTSPIGSPRGGPHSPRERPGERWDTPALPPALNSSSKCLERGHGSSGRATADAARSPRHRLSDRLSGSKPGSSKRHGTESEGTQLLGALMSSTAGATAGGSSGDDGAVPAWVAPAGSRDCREPAADDPASELID